MSIKEIEQMIEKIATKYNIDEDIVGEIMKEIVYALGNIK